MSTALRWLYMIALIVWLGEVIFFSFVVAPAMFRTFATPEAGRAVGAIFPIYYRIGYVCGAILLVVGGVLLDAAGAKLWWSVAVALAAVMLAATVYAGVVIQPRATALRPQIHEPGAPDAVQAEFHRLHQQAVALNSVVLICGVAVSIITASSLRP